ncbi:hypothetical protein AMTR_s00081p00175290 [Amborella trichopoda]|uniref:Uncharacterized protein n=1 Tax=Amborella trichopoda TaxID=13333 RepID=W1PAC1_AMBTC|nr:hypothetical protein AMTR_s00081p00175290 [Amborella trichopoda]
MRVCLPQTVTKQNAFTIEQNPSDTAHMLVACALMHASPSQPVRLCVGMPSLPPVHSSPSQHFSLNKALSEPTVFPDETSLMPLSFRIRLLFWHPTDWKELAKPRSLDKDETGMKNLSLRGEGRCGLRQCKRSAQKSKSASPALARGAHVCKKGSSTSDTSAMSPLMKRVCVGVHIASTPPPVMLVFVSVVGPGMTVARPGGPSPSLYSLGRASKDLPSRVECRECYGKRRPLMGSLLRGWWLHQLQSHQS